MRRFLSNYFDLLFKYGSESSTGAKVKGHESCLWSESSRGAKVPWNESSWASRSRGANVPRNESFTGAKVLSMDFSLPGTKVQRNEESRYHPVTVVTYEMHAVA